MPLDPSLDPFGASARSPADQARAASAVTPSDSADLPAYAKALYVGQAGDLRVIPVANADAAPVTFKAHPVGYLPIQVRRVLAAGTTAGDIVALFD